VRAKGNLLRAGQFALMVWMLAPSAARACDCVNAGPPCKALANTPTVFVGRALKIAAAVNGYRPVTFEVAQAYRGMTEKTAEVHTGAGGGDCGYEFREGATYLVYAAPQAETGKLYTGICQRTRPLSDATDDIEFLTRKDDPTRGAGIEGDVLALTRDAQNNTSVTGPMPGITVTISGISVRRTAVTRTDGHFHIRGLDPGAYRVSPMLPDGFLKTAQTVTLAVRSCEEVRFLATPPPRKGTQ
jgi:hypothetical protein